MFRVYFTMVGYVDVEADDAETAEDLVHHENPKVLAEGVDEAEVVEVTRAPRS